MHSFSIISVVALLCYFFQFTSLLTIKRNNQINSFLCVLSSMLLWMGGSLLMRIDFWPSIDLWFHVSLTGLLLMPLSLFAFIRRFMEVEKTFHIYFWGAMTGILLLANYVSEYFLAPPAMKVTADGYAFVYDFTWPVAWLFFAGIGTLLACLRMIRANYSKEPFMRAQIRPIMVGILIIALGNALLLLPLFEGIPIDVFSGILMAICLYYALYRKRLFPFSAIASKANCYAAAFFVSIIVFYRLIPTYEQYLRVTFEFTENQSTLIVALTVTIMVLAIYMLLQSILNRVFEKEESVQSKSIIAFSGKMYHLMGLEKILQELMDTVLTVLLPKRIYIFIKEKDGNFTLRSTNVVQDDFEDFIFPADSPFVKLLNRAGGSMLRQDYSKTEAYDKLPKAEKKILEAHAIDCVVGLCDEEDLMGMILLSEKVDCHKYSNKDMNYLASINSVASIAMRNALLYEEAYEESRRDYLTGVANRKRFYEEMQKCCEESNYSFGSLVMINVDDFKLYNQLYGDEAGDEALKEIARIIERQVQVDEFACIARYSGKEFAVLLPEYTEKDAVELAERISGQIREMNHNANQNNEYALKALTVSCGIAFTKCPTDDYHQILNQANQAVYYAKQAGKNRVVVYKEGQGMEKDREPGSYKPGVYSDYSSTIYALTAAIDAKDHYTFNHSENVAYYARELATAYGMNEEGINIAYEAGLLHDIGKIGIDEKILNKPGKLTEQEYEVMKTHVVLSIGIIRHLPSLDYVIPAVIGHHERYDGKGYPRGIRGTDIPLLARILCIADSFDAMVSERTYKEPMETERALVILQEEAGKQFDPELAPIFIRQVKNGMIKVRK